MPATGPVLVTVTAAVNVPLDATDASTTRSEYANCVYDRPNPNGRSGVESVDVTSDGPPRIGCR